MSFDMTLGTSGGFGGGSGWGGFLGGIGAALPANLAANLNMASNLYNFAAQNAIAPSAINAQVGYNNALQQQNQLKYTELYKANEGLNAGINSQYWDWFNSQSPEVQARARQELMQTYGASLPQAQSVTPAQQTNTQQATPAQQQQGLTAASPQQVQYRYSPETQADGTVRMGWRPTVDQVWSR